VGGGLGPAATPLPAGRTRRLASGTLKHFADRGVPDEDGLLSLGWYRPFLPITQPYSGPASPYWANKAFLGLLLPADHPVWTAREEAGPVDTADRYLALPAPGWLLHSTAADGIVRLINHGSDHQSPTSAAQDDPHYTRFAYSTATAPETPPAEEAPGPDNQITLLDAPAPSERGRIHRLYARGRRAASWHTRPVDGDAEYARISTASVAHGPWEVRIHRVEAPEGALVREGGWAVADDDAPPLAQTGDGWTAARRKDGLTSALVALLGWQDEGASCRTSVASARGHNAYGHHSATPLLTARHPGGTRILASLVVLTADPSVYGDLDALRTGTKAIATPGGSVRVVFPDGTTEEVGVTGEALM
jgi:hypothetical protein